MRNLLMLPGFDSILVRLKGYGQGYFITTHLCFDSILVRLKGVQIGYIGLHWETVSIPYWFD